MRKLNSFEFILKQMESHIAPGQDDAEWLNPSSTPFPALSEKI